MGKGIANVEYVRQGSEVTVADQPNWGFIYRVSAVKDEKWAIGDRVVLPDGREFNYAKSLAACIAGQGAEFTATGYTAYTAFAVSAAIGDTAVTVPAATHAALTKDELRGGYAILYNAGNAVQFRGIIGNDASILNVAFKIYLDGPLTEAVVAAVAGIETFQNPYAALRTGTSTNLSKAGVPASTVSAADLYFWVQTAGFSWAAPQAGVGATKDKGLFWRHDGSLESVTTALAVTPAANDTGQYAGFVVEGSAAGNGPLIMLRG